MDINAQKIIVLDFGSQYSQLIARRIREAKVFSQILPFNTSINEIRKLKPHGIILSGGPCSIYDEKAPYPDTGIFDLDIPILGICYGMQLICKKFGGTVARAQRREYGSAQLLVDEQEGFLNNLTSPLAVWMSHGDQLSTLPADFIRIAHTDNSPIAAMRHKVRPLYGVQFHPEVAHTPQGAEIIENFLFNICKCEPSWNMSSFVSEAICNIRRQAGHKHVICALSGGVDSSVVALLLHKAIGDKLYCIFVDNGLLRKGEAQAVKNTFAGRFHINLNCVAASERFSDKLYGVTDPEKKRKIIGNEFIYLFEEEAHKLGKIDFLAQGTLYPDVIESISIMGPSSTIKSHHNVGGLPETMKLELIEPLRELFKDEVRLVGKELGLAETIIGRHPFPGPGLAIRILGEITKERLNMLREADAIVIQEFKRSGWYNKVWQAFAVLLPIRTVGVMGDERTYDNVIALRAVNSQDGMTADWVRLPYELLNIISNRIINEVAGINRVTYDISSKPPSTIEWE